MQQVIGIQLPELIFLSLLLFEGLGQTTFIRCQAFFLPFNIYPKYLKMQVSAREEAIIF